MHINNIWEGVIILMYIIGIIVGLVKDIKNEGGFNFAAQTISAAIWLWLLTNAGLFR